jgi:uncharacterized protein YyaL (SSP411 family)
MPNRLRDAASTYLRQHADNPVDWYIWNEAAFSLARQLDRPILLSVGYSSCHWCHVMAHESFEDASVAQVLNRAFVSIKLDREERPDVDDAYMTAVQLTSGRGGWPMTVFLTPDLKPFFAGTYFPKEDRGGRIGFLNLCRQVEQVWQARREDVEATAADLAERIQKANASSLEPLADLSALELARRCLRALEDDFDEANGGFGGAPKFPPHSALRFLRELASDGRFTTGERASAAKMRTETLRKIADGGIHDHVGGGFHRYSTDANWHLPHFEKMLYDNALLLEEFAASASEDVVFAVARDGIVRWLEREMRAENGAFFAALDADSLDADGHAEEGAFYTWPYDEAVKETAESFAIRYRILRNGNFRDEATGQPMPVNVFHRDAPYEAADDAAFAQLLTLRSSRPRPTLDDKCLTGWNGLAIRALVTAGRVDLAWAAAQPFLAHVDRLPRMLVGGEPHGTGFLEDFAALGLGLLACSPHLSPEDSQRGMAAANRMADQIQDQFADPNGGFFFTLSDHGEIFGRTKPIFDAPIPSANALAVELFHLLGRTGPVERAVSWASGWMHRAPTATEAMHSVALLAGPQTVEAIIEDMQLRLKIPSGWSVELHHPKPVASGIEIDWEQGSRQADELRFPIKADGGEPAWVCLSICDDRVCLPPHKILCQRVAKM